MKTFNQVTSACRSCRHFRPEGRRGGLCQQLGVPVRGSWSACSLASPAFAPSWESLEEIMLWQDESLKAQEALSLSSSGFSQVNAIEPKNVSATLQLTDEDALLVERHHRINS